MVRKNLFISNYLQIEREIINLSRSIDFCDEQLGVYSAAICDLIIRCGSDIESIYKELYRRYISKILPKTVGEAVIKLDKKLDLANKKLIINNEYLNFTEFKDIKPFGYKKRTDGDFYHIFCCLKHDREKAFHKAKLKTLLLSLGALYILNQYYLDRQSLIENSFFGEVIPSESSEDTAIFSALVFNEAWSVANLRLDYLRGQKGITDITIDKVKKILIEKAGISFVDHNKGECLFRAEVTPGYREMLKSYSDKIGDNDIAKMAFIAQFFGDDKDIEALLEEHGADALDAIMSLASESMCRYRLRVVINR